jgi:hypothetical protein
MTENELRLAMWQAFAEESSTISILTANEVINRTIELFKEKGLLTSTESEPSSRTKAVVSAFLENNPYGEVRLSGHHDDCILPSTHDGACELPE